MVSISGSLPKDTYGFTYKGKHSGRDFDMWLVKSPIDFLVEAKDSLEDIPWSAGQFDFGATLGSREIELELVIRATSETDLRNKRRAIASWLSPAKGLGELWWDTEPDKYYNARRYGGAQSIEMLSKQGAFTLPFIAPDPYAYSRTESDVVFSAGGTKTINNIGTEEAGPVITVKGTNTSGTLTITYGGQTMTFSGALAASDTLTIDTDDMSIYKTASNGVKTNMLNSSNGKFPKLQVGANSVQVAATNFTITSVTFKPGSRWE